VKSARFAKSRLSESPRQDWPYFLEKRQFYSGSSGDGPRESVRTGTPYSGNAGLLGRLSIPNGGSAGQLIGTAGMWRTKVKQAGTLSRLNSGF
jgi:hypothetical protein